MNDVEKTNIRRQNSSRRIRRRKRMMNAYALVVTLLVIAAGVTICSTFFFNIDEIVLYGESENYKPMEIINASGVRVGDNLLRLNTRETENQILEKLVYVESAELEKKFPATLNINVTRCIPGFNIEYEEGVLLVSRKGKILAVNKFYTDGLPVIKGFEPDKPVIGEPAVSEREHINDAFRQLTERFDRGDTDAITEIDFANEQEITVNYKNGMVFRMGNWNEIDYKMNLAANVMEDESIKGKKGYLTMIGANQCSFRTSDKPAEPVNTVPAEKQNEELINTEEVPVQNEQNIAGDDTGDWNADDGWTDDAGWSDEADWNDDAEWNNWENNDENYWDDDSSWNEWDDNYSEW